MSEEKKVQVDSIVEAAAEMGERERELLVAYTEGLKAGVKTALMQTAAEAAGA